MYELYLRRALKSDPEIWDNWQLHARCQTEEEARKITQELAYALLRPSHKTQDFVYQAQRRKDGVVDIEFIEYVSHDEINALMLALNHYISTGDHIGEGVVLPDEEDGVPQEGFYRVLVPYAPRELEDADNWKRLYARLTQLQKEEAFPMGILDLGPTPGGFHTMGLALHQRNFGRLTAALREKPGPLGWGSMRSFLQAKGIIGPGAEKKND